MPLITSMVEFINQRLHEKDYAHRKTSVGEIMCFIGYIGALCLYPGEPLSRMWADKPSPNNTLPPSAVGRHGLKKDHFKLLRSLADKLFLVSEAELDVKDRSAFT
eukprot:2604960-Pleurochrysis_carterae.AAC.1